MPNADITKRLLADALKQVMAKKPLAKINIGDITQAYGISRNTFYYHFKDKYALVNWIFSTEIMEELDGDGAELLHRVFYGRHEGRREKRHREPVFGPLGPGVFLPCFLPTP